MRMCKVKEGERNAVVGVSLKRGYGEGDGGGRVRGEDEDGMDGVDGLVCWLVREE